MNARQMVARELVAVAKLLTGGTFTEEGWKKHKQEHPGANRSDHTITRTDNQPSSEGAPKTPATRPHKKVKPTSESVSKVHNVMSANKLRSDSDEMGEMMGFKKTLGERIPEADKGKYYVRNEAKLKADFLKNMSPSNYDSPEAFKAAKDRIKAMPTSDFGKVLAAISDEDEAGMKKGATRTARLLNRHEKLLDKWAQSSEGQRALSRGHVSYDDLPATLVAALERVKDTETLWSDTERYLGDLAMKNRYGRVASRLTADMTWDQCIKDWPGKRPGHPDDSADKFCAWLKMHGPNASIREAKQAVASEIISIVKNLSAEGTRR